MVAKKGKVKKRNPSDLTLRNLRALKKRIEVLEKKWDLLIEVATERAEKKVEHIIKLERK